VETGVIDRIRRRNRRPPWRRWPAAPGDTAETLDYGRMAKVIRGVYAVAMEF
jgi:hypothetical protein